MTNRGSVCHSKWPVAIHKDIYGRFVLPNSDSAEGELIRIMIKLSVRKDSPVKLTSSLKLVFMSCHFD